MADDDTIGRIVGARLTSVQFVLDYLILGFDERGALTTLVWPEIDKQDQILAYGMLEYRNCLCELISHTVTKASEMDETFRITFENHFSLLIDLKRCDRAGERAILTGPDHFLRVY